MKVDGINRLIIAAGMLPQIEIHLLYLSICICACQAVDTVLQFRPPAAAT